MNSAELLGSPGGVSQAVLDKLSEELAATFHGLPYLFARSSYGNELNLHFGAERSYNHPKLADKVRGTCVLSVRGSAWLFTSGTRPLIIGRGIIPSASDPDSAKPFNVSDPEGGAPIGRGAKVTRAFPLAVGPLKAIGLSLSFEDSSNLLIVPTPPDRTLPDLPEPSDWEFLAPGRVLRVGPGPISTVEEFGPHGG